MSDGAHRSRTRSWPTDSEETVARLKLFDLIRSTRRSPTTGRQHDFLRLRAPDWVNVVAVTIDGELILVEQYRHGTEEVTVEIPGGCVDEGEGPARAAVRELEEETGYRIGELHQIGVVEPNPAFLSNRCFTFLALGCRPEGRLQPDPTEEITVRLVPPARFGDLIADGSIRHALVVAAHDHLRRALERRPPWAAALRATE